jgi:PAS domain-containing protein
LRDGVAVRGLERQRLQNQHVERALGDALLLADALEVPLRERNALLLAAGFAPIFRESRLDDPCLDPVRMAIDAILAQQEPFPAVVMDRRWEIIVTNEAARRFFGWRSAPVVAIAAVLEEILSYPGVPREWRTPDVITPLVPVIPVRFARISAHSTSSQP